MTLSALIGGNLELVATDVHTAPAARALLARVKEVNDARFALPQTMSLQVAEKTRHPVKDGCPQICWPLGVKERLPNNPAVPLAERRDQRMLQKPSIPLLDELGRRCEPPSIRRTASRSRSRNSIRSLRNNAASGECRQLRKTAFVFAEVTIPEAINHRSSE